MISICIVLMHWGKGITGKGGSWAGKASVGVLLIAATRAGALMTEATDLVRELMSTTRDVMSTRIATS